MNSHPCPKNVLVIGGGDGGVLREVVKHSTVENAILCDIDESVIRLSKKYLPSMSIGFQHPNVSTHIGDGFKFLADKKNEFDVIITDSSDPEGPAESLFQKPYFELLHGALKEGGVITTQGCWSLSFTYPLLSSSDVPCSILTKPCTSRKPMASSISHQRPETILQRSVPCCRVCLHNDTYVSKRTNWLHGLLQGQGPRRQETFTELECGRGGEAMSVLQQRHPYGELHPADLCQEGVAVKYFQAIASAKMARRLMTASHDGKRLHTWN